MRHVTVTINGTAHNMPVNFGVLRAITARGIDPLTAAARASGDGNALTLVQVTELLYEGVSASGAKLSLADVEQAVMDSGLALLPVAMTYLTSFVMGGPTRKNAEAPLEEK